MNFLTNTPPIFRVKQLPLLDAAFKEASISIGKLFHQELDRVFREALIREFGKVPDDDTIRQYGRVVIDRDNTHRLMWFRGDRRYHEIAAVTCQFCQVPLPPTL